MAAITTHSSVPDKFTAGDSVLWTVGYSDYPASSSWELTYYFQRDGRDTIEISGTASGDDFAVTVSPSESGEFTAGVWKWVARAELQGTGAAKVARGLVTVEPDPAAAHTKSFAEKALEMLEASFQNDLPTAQESVSIAGVDITMMSLSERFELRNKFRREVEQERFARRMHQGEDVNSSIQFAFNS